MTQPSHPYPEVAVIGGGAAGFFLAIHLKQARPETRVVILERSRRLLAKVRISGGGRCNLTNSFASVCDLSHVYPRGHRLMSRLLRQFGPKQTCVWFESHGVPLVTQDDDCVFPRSQDSASVTDCLLREARSAGVEVLTQHPVRSVAPHASGRLEVSFADGRPPQSFDKVALTTGGAPHGEGHDWLAALGHRIESPCPSLFTFTVREPNLTALTGIVVEKAQVALAGTKFRAAGPLLITHWGLSGPAILKLSSYAARHLSERGYRAPLSVCWAGEPDAGAVADCLKKLAAGSPRRKLASLRPYGLQGRLWTYLLQRTGIAPDKPCGEAGSKSINRLAAILTADSYTIGGRSAFREEFVTCGGVSLRSINPATLESLHTPGLFFAGEILDIDGITGGFNLQAAWTTAHTAASAMSAGSPLCHS